jgi:hypothetical protein
VGQECVDEVAAVLQRLTCWVRERLDVRDIALVGSWANGTRTRVGARRRGAQRLAVANRVTDELVDNGDGNRDAQYHLRRSGRAVPPEDVEVRRPHLEAGSGFTLFR